MLQKVPRLLGTSPVGAAPSLKVISQIVSEGLMILEECESEGLNGLCVRAEHHIQLHRTEEDWRLVGPTMSHTPVTQSSSSGSFLLVLGVFFSTHTFSFINLNLSLSDFHL